jgi:hypothetical protein
MIQKFKDSTALSHSSVTARGCEGLRGVARSCEARSKAKQPIEKESLDCFLLRTSQSQGRDGGNSSAKAATPANRHCECSEAAHEKGMSGLLRCARKDGRRKALARTNGGNARKDSSSKYVYPNQATSANRHCERSEAAQTFFHHGLLPASQPLAVARTGGGVCWDGRRRAA